MFLLRSLYRFWFVSKMRQSTVTAFSSLQPLEMDFQIPEVNMLGLQIGIQYILFQMNFSC